MNCGPPRLSRRWGERACARTERERQIFAAAQGSSPQNHVGRATCSPMNPNTLAEPLAQLLPLVAAGTGTRARHLRVRGGRGQDGDALTGDTVHSFEG